MNGIISTAHGNSGWKSIVEATAPSRTRGSQITVYVKDDEYSYLLAKTQQGVKKSHVVQRALSLMRQIEQSNIDINQLLK